jgi:hypothetical protein
MATALVLAPTTFMLANKQILAAEGLSYPKNIVVENP